MSQQLRALLEPERFHALTIGEFIEQLSESGFAVVLGALALPAVIPVFPPGTAVLIGLVFALVGARMLLGGTGLWVPERWRRRPLPRGFAAALLARGVPVAERIERLRPPRLRAGRWLIRAAGLAPLLMGFVMIAPLPALNTAPALVVLLLAVGLIRDDAILITAALLAGLALAGGAIVALPLLIEALLARLQSWLR